MINTILWVLQAILAVKALTTGFTHAFQHNKDTLRGAIQKMGAPARPLLAASAALLFLGALGLILPGALGFLPWLAPGSAALLAVLMLLSIPLHLKSREDAKVFADVILFVLCVLVAVGRWTVAPF